MLTAVACPPSPIFTFSLFTLAPRTSPRPSKQQAVRSTHGQIRWLHTSQRLQKSQECVLQIVGLKVNVKCCLQPIFPSVESEPGKNVGRSIILIMKKLIGS